MPVTPTITAAVIPLRYRALHRPSSGTDCDDGEGGCGKRCHGSGASRGSGGSVGGGGGGSSARTPPHPDVKSGALVEKRATPGGSYGADEGEGRRREGGVASDSGSVVKSPWRLNPGQSRQ